MNVCLFALLFIILWDVRVLCTRNDNTNILCIKLIFGWYQLENLSGGQIFSNSRKLETWLDLLDDISLQCSMACVISYLHRQTPNISHTSVGNTIVVHSDVVGVSALLQLYFHSRLNTCLQWIRQRQLRDETRNISVLGVGASYIRGLMVVLYCLVRKVSHTVVFELVCELDYNRMQITSNLFEPILPR